MNHYKLVRKLNATLRIWVNTGAVGITTGDANDVGTAPSVAAGPYKGNGFTNNELFGSAFATGISSTYQTTFGA